MKEKMTNYWICKACETCRSICYHQHKQPHKEKEHCHSACVVDDKAVCKRMSIKEYAVWRLTHSKEVV